MRVLRNDPLTLVFRPRWVIVASVSAGTFFLGMAAIGVVQGGVSMDTFWGPMIGFGMMTVWHLSAVRFWTVLVDRESRRVRWWVWSVFGTRYREFGFDEIAGVALVSNRTRGGRGPAPRSVALVPLDGEAIPLSWYRTTKPKGVARLRLIAGLLRQEIGLPEPGEDLEVADAIAAASSHTEAVQAAKRLLGVSLEDANTIAKGIRRG